MEGLLLTVNLSDDPPNIVLPSPSIVSSIPPINCGAGLITSPRPSDVSIFSLLYHSLPDSAVF